jgi:hypothetical protein
MARSVYSTEGLEDVYRPFEDIGSKKLEEGVEEFVGVMERVWWSLGTRKGRSGAGAYWM